RLLRLWIVLVLVFCAFGSGDLAAGDWPQFLGPNRDGTSDETGLIDQLSQNSLRIQWTVDVADGFSGPVVIGDRVLVFEQVDREAVLRCLANDTGKTIWNSSYPCRFNGGLAGGGRGPRATPVVLDGMVYTIGPNGVLRCVQLADGKAVWS